MNWTSIRPWLATAARLVLGVVWLWSSVSKLHDPRTFVQAVRAYDATPEWLSRFIGYGLPVLEFALGLLLIIGVITRVVAAVSAVLFVVFVIGIVQASARGIRIECGCFGGGGASTTTSYLLDIVRDVALLILAAFLVWWPLSQLSIDERLARKDHVPAPSAKRLRTGDGARKYNAMVEARRREARSRNLYLTAAIGAMVVLIAVIGVGVQSGRAKISGDLSATNATRDNGVVEGSKTAKAVVDVYEDFQCPVCQQFQTTAGPTLDQMISDGRAQVRFHMIAILDNSSNGNRYSSRAANASICASDISVADFLKYHDYLYGTDKSGAKIQPGEDAHGRSDADLIGYARAIGMSSTDVSTFQTCVQSEQHKALVQAMTDRASEQGVTGTPTIIVNGKTLADNNLSTLQKAVTAVAGAAPPASSSGSPSGSATAPVSASVSPSASASASQ